jgi:hypothetical protein
VGGVCPCPRPRVSGGGGGVAFLTWPGGASAPLRDQPRGRCAGLRGCCATSGGGVTCVAGGRDTGRTRTGRGLTPAERIAALWRALATARDSTRIDRRTAGATSLRSARGASDEPPAISSNDCFASETPGRLPKPSIPRPRPTSQRQARNVATNATRRSRRARRPSAATKIARLAGCSVVARSRSTTVTKSWLPDEASP